MDTHTFIWFINGDNQLPVSTRQLITSTSNKCFLIIASIWEIALKTSLDKLELQGDFNQIAGFLKDNDIEILPINFEHIKRLIQLSLIHRDSFDRIIIAQALTENLTVANKDTVFHDYAVLIIWK